MATGEISLSEIDIEPNENLCFVYSEEEDIGKVVVPVFSQALKIGQKCFFVGSLDSFYRIRDELEKLGINVRESLKSRYFTYIENNGSFSLSLVSLIEYIMQTQRKESNKKVRIIIELSDGIKPLQGQIAQQIH